MTEKNKCEICGKEGEDVAYEADPFILEIDDEIVMRWLCSQCWQERADDI